MPPAGDLWLLSVMKLSALNVLDQGRNGASEQGESEPRDPKGHRLLQCQAPLSGLYCGLCASSFDQGTTVHACFDCDFFVCSRCFARVRANNGHFGPRPLLSPQEQHCSDM